MSQLQHARNGSSIKNRNSDGRQCKQPDYRRQSSSKCQQQHDTVQALSFDINTGTGQSHSDSSLPRSSVVLPRNEVLQKQQSPQARRLQLRNSRFRGPTLSGFSPTSSLPLPSSSSSNVWLQRRKKTCPSLDGHFSDGGEEVRQEGEDGGREREREGDACENETGPSSSPLSSPTESRLKMHRQDNTFDDLIEPGVLQEISNSSLRRKKRLASRITQAASLRQSVHNENLVRHEASFVKPWDKESPASSPVSSIGHGQSSGEGGVSPDSTHSTGSKNGFRPLRMLSRSSRSAIPRRSISGGTSKYIENLESELAAAQTQLQTFTSPTATTSQAAKFRAVTSELKLLRQELADWETKFEQRVQEQVDHHDHVTAALNIQIKALEREKESSDLRIKELELKDEEKNIQLLAVEGANYDLERRLELMSELIVTSPTRERSSQHSDSLDTAQQTGHATSSRSRSNLGFQRLSLVTSGQRIHRLSNASSFGNDMRSTLGSPQSLDKSFSSHGNPFYPVAAGSERLACPSTESEPETFEVPSLLEDASRMTNSCHRRNSSTTRHYTTDDEMKKRLPRRMRRFYTGSNGPKPLILPVTTNTNSFPLSAPVSAAPTPVLPLRSSFSASQHGRFGSRDIHRPTHPVGHRRSATWDHDALLISPRSTDPSEDEDSRMLVSSLTYSVDETFEKNNFESYMPDITSSPLAKDGTLLTHQLMSPTERLLANGNLFEELCRVGGSDNVNNCMVLDSKQSGNNIGFDDGLEGPTLDTVNEITTHVAAAPTLSDHEASTERTSTSNSELFSTSISSNTTLKADSLMSRRPVDQGKALSEECQGLGPTSLHEQRGKLIFPRNYSPDSHLMHLLNAVSNSLNSQHPAASQIITNAWSWSLSSLCWPVVRFRWWLVRLLLGDLWKRRNEERGRGKYSLLRDLLNGNSPRPEMIVLMPGTIRKLGLVRIFEDETSSSGPYAVKHQRNVSVTSEDEYDFYLDGEEEDRTLIPTKGLNASNRNDLESLDRAHCVTSTSVTSTNVTGTSSSQMQTDHASEACEKADPAASPISWLKFSLTLCFAIGIAIKDGPAALFKRKHYH